MWEDVENKMCDEQLHLKKLCTPESASDEEVCFILSWTDVCLSIFQLCDCRDLEDFAPERGGSCCCCSNRHNSVRVVSGPFWPPRLWGEPLLMDVKRYSQTQIFLVPVFSGCIVFWVVEKVGKANCFSFSCLILLIWVNLGRVWFGWKGVCWNRWGLIFWTWLSFEIRCLLLILLCTYHSLQSVGKHLTVLQGIIIHLMFNMFRI